MVDSLNLSNVSVDENGRVRFSGLTTGIDFVGAVDNIIAARRIPIDRLEAKVTENDEKIAAFNELRGLMNGFRTSLDALRGKVTFGGAGNIFNAKEVFASSSSESGTPSAAGNLVGISVTNAAALGSHTLEVLQIAQAHKISTASAVSQGDDLGLAFGGASGSIFGSFEINGRLIEVQATDNLVDLADRINAANTGGGTTGVAASIVSVDTNDHVLVLTASESGTQISITNAQQTSGLVADNTAQLDSYTAVTGTGNTFDIEDSTGAVIGTVTYDNTDTLDTLQAKIDAISGISASVVADGASFRLQIDSDDGSTIQLDNDSLGANGAIAQLGFPGDVLSQLGISSDGGTNFLNELRTAQNAQIRADSLIDNAAFQSAAVATADTAFNATGNLTITLPDSSDHIIAVGAADTPNSLATTINNDLTLQAAGIGASVIAESDGTFRLEIRKSDLTTTDVGDILAARVNDPAVDNLGIDGSLTFAFDSGQIAQIAVTDGDTMNDVRDAVNADVDLQNAGISASVVVTSDGTSKLVIQRDATLTASGPASLGLAKPELIIERTSNTIDDLFDGMTISLFQAEEGTTINLDVEQNLNSVKESIATFVDSYNAIKSFINQQSLVDPSTGAKSDDAGPLYGNSGLATIEQNLASFLGAGAQGLSDGVQVLREIGIDFTDNNAIEDPLLADTLVIDETILDEALLNDAEGVRKLFAFDFSASDPRVSLLSFNGSTEVADAGYTLDVTVSGGVVTAATFNGVAGSATVNGNVITATDATGANGLSVIYTGTASASNIAIDFSAGVGHELFFEIDRLLDSEAGALETEVNTLTDQTEQTQERIDTMLERLDAQRERLLERFVAMEAAISSMETTLNAIREQVEALRPRNN